MMGSMKTMIDFIKSLRMAKIPGDTGGPAGAAGSMAGPKRKRIEQQHESEDSEEDNEKTEGQNPKAKKKSATVSDVKPSDSPWINFSKPDAAVPLKVNLKVAEPVASSVVPLQAPKPALPTAWQLLGEPKMPSSNSSTPRCQQALEFFPTTQAPSTSQILRCSLHPALYFLPSRAIQ